MNRIALLAGGAVLAFSSSLAVAGGPEDLLPPAFREAPRQATPTPSPTPRATPTPAPAPTSSQPTTQSTSSPVVQPLPGGGQQRSRSSSSSGPSVSLPSGFPTLRELEQMDNDEANAILGLRPKFDIPAAARRDLAEVGIISRQEGGFASNSLANQPAALVRAALQASDGPLASRWGHILFRRVLASRLEAPRGMNPVDFAALRAEALGAMGEGAVARSLVQDVDGGNYNRALADAAFDAYLATGDVLGMCPVARLQTDLRDDGEWELLQGLCLSYLGQTRTADRRLNRALGTGAAPEIDVRLAQRLAGASGESARAINVEWDGVDELNPWRFALARAVGLEIPDSLRESGTGPERYDISEVLIPAAPLLDRVAASDRAGARGVLSSSAMVDLYSQLWASEEYSRDVKSGAGLLRRAYVADTAAQRAEAIQQLWEGDDSYGRLVLTAYAAARIPASDALEAKAAPLIASMLSAGLDRNALLWNDVVADGSEGWALLALAQPDLSGTVSNGSINDFIDGDESVDKRKSAYLVAGLAGLGRIDADDLADFGEDFGVNYGRNSPWSAAIGRAAQVNNPALVAILVGLGMQGNSWDSMTPRHLYHIVTALDRTGLQAEARMIAAEAVARS